MRKKLTLVLTVAVIIFVFDYLTKEWIVDNVPQGTVITVVDGFFDIVHGRNTGAAFGFLHNWNSPLKNWFFYFVGALALAFMFNYVRALEEHDKASLFALGLVFGGAIGNIFDRATRGSVVDFLSVHYHHGLYQTSLFGYRITIPLDWPAFNVADSAISVALVILIVTNLAMTVKRR